MVGIVLVSHSHPIAEGVAELAREMGGTEVKLETAGGLDLPDRPIGTDAVLVLQAIERAWSEDGVLVLMDLGSAVLSAEMALDLLPEERRANVVLCEAPFVEGAVAAAVTAKMGASLEQVAAEARGGLGPKQTHLGQEVPGGVETAAGVATDAETRSTRLTVETPHGLHARPAARFVQTASSFDADVRVSNVTADRGPANARSLNAVATLGVGRGDEIEVVATGAQAQATIDAITALAERSFDEVPEEPAPTPAAAAAAAAADRGSAAERVSAGTVLRGPPASPGVAIGAARRFHAPPIEVPDRPAGEPEAERRALGAAIEAARADVADQRAAVAGRAGEYQAAIFDAHLLFLSDESLLEPARRAIDGGASAARAWRDATEEVAGVWEGLDDEYQRARAADLRSVGTQVLAHLAGVEAPRPRIDAPGILVAADLAPADAAALDPELALGLVTAFGGPTSHAAILARALGLPAVVGLGEPVLAIEEGTELCLDGDAGELHVAPGDEVVAAFRDRRDRRDAEERAARAVAHEPAETRDGHRVEVAANVGSPEGATSAADAGADGIGLLRTEFLFLDRRTAPSEDEQASAYRRVAEALAGRPVIVRTLDAGADKPLPYLEQPSEANPFLGVRGVRLSLARPFLLRTQLRAVLRVAAAHPVRVMFPMVATLEEARAAKDALEEARASFPPGDAAREALLEVGVMVEVPSAALLADALASELDFFSIGTNDLTQYTLAADRGNERVAGLADALHPAVLALIARTAEAATAHGRWVGVCGELAGDPGATAILVGLGVRELSMSVGAIARVKEAVRAVDAAEAASLARRALACTSASEVRALAANSLGVRR